MRWREQGVAAPGRVGCARVCGKRGVGGVGGGRGCGTSMPAAIQSPGVCASWLGWAWLAEQAARRRDSSKGGDAEGAGGKGPDGGGGDGEAHGHPAQAVQQRSRLGGVGLQVHLAALALPARLPRPPPHPILLETPGPDAARSAACICTHASAAALSPPPPPPSFPKSCTCSGGGRDVCACTHGAPAVLSPRGRRRCAGRARLREGRGGPDQRDHCGVAAGGLLAPVPPRRWWRREVGAPACAWAVWAG